MRKVLMPLAILFVGLVAGGGAYYGANALGLFDKSVTEDEREKARASLEDYLKDVVKNGGDALKGASVDKVEREGEQLTLVGTIDSQEQGEKLKEEAKYGISEDPLRRRAFPGKLVTTTRLAVNPLRSLHLATLRTQFAAAGAKGDERGKILSRTRLTDLAPSDDSVEIHGIYLLSKADVEGKREGAIREAIRGAVKDHLKGALGKGDLRVTVDKLRLDSGVVADLARAVREAGFAGSGLGNPSYDASGVLKLSGVAPSEAKRNEFVRAAQAAFAKTDAAKAAAVKDGVPSCEVDVVVPDAGRLPGLVQAKAAASKSDVSKRTRFDGFEAATGDDDGLVLKWRGVRLATSKDEDDATKAALAASLAAWLDGVLAEELAGGKARPRVDVSGFLVRRSPVAALQQELKKTPTLRDAILGRPYFGPKGELEIPAEDSDLGEQGKKDLAALLGKAKKEFAGAGEGEEEEGSEVVALDDDKKEDVKKDKPSRMELTAVEIQKKLAADETFKYARVDRVEQDEEGGFVLYGVAAKAVTLAEKEKQDDPWKKFVEANMRDALEKAGWTSKGVMDTAKYKAADERGFVVLEAPHVAAQKESKKERDLDGLLLRQPWFDDKGQVVFPGLGTGKEQEKVKGGGKTRLAALCEAAGLGQLVEAKRAGNKTVTLTPAFGKLTVVSWGDWQAELAAAPEGRAEPLRQVWLDRVRFVYDDKGEERLTVEGVSISPATDPRTPLRKWVGRRIEARADKATADKFDTIHDFDKNFETQPAFFEGLRKAVRSNEMAGVLLADVGSAGGLRWSIGLKLEKDAKPEEAEKAKGGDQATGFDATGQLQLVGVVSDDKQKKELQKLAEEASAKFGKRVTVGTDGLHVLTPKQAADQIQRALAASARPDLKRTRIDAASFRYPAKADKGVAALALDGVALAAPKGGEPKEDGPFAVALREAVARALRVKAGDKTYRLTVTEVTGEKDKEVAREGNLFDGDTEAVGIDDAGVVRLANPRVKLQKAAADRDDLAGVLVERVWYGPDGKLILEARADDEGKKDAVKKLPADALTKEREKAAHAGGVEAKVTAWQWQDGSGVTSWAGFEKALQKGLSGKAPSSTKDADWPFRQTGLSRAFLEYDEKENLVLAFEGKTLYTPGVSEADADAAAKYTAATPAQRRDYLTAKDALKIRESRFGKLKERLAGAHPKILKGLDAKEIDLGRLELHENPHKTLMKNRPEQLKLDATIIWAVYYDGKGEPTVFAEQVERPEELRKFLAAEKALTDLSLKPAAKKEGRLGGRRDVRFVAARREGEEADADAPPKLDYSVFWRWQAKAAVSEKLRHLRIDECYPDSEDEAGGFGVVYRASVVSIRHDLAGLDVARRGELEERIKADLRKGLGLAPAQAIDLKLKAATDPVFTLQSSANNLAGADGLLFYNARFGPDAALVIDAHFAADGHPALAEEIRRGLRLPDELTLTAPPGRDPNALRLLSAPDLGGWPRWWPSPRFSWRDMIAQMRARFAGDGGPARRTRIDGASFRYPDPKRPERIELVWRGVSLEDNEDGGSSDAVRKGLQSTYLGRFPQHLPFVAFDGFEGFTHSASGVDVLGTPVRDMRRQVVADKLDGVGVGDVYFDKDARLVVSGVWDSPAQSRPTRELVADVLKKRGLDDDGFRTIFGKADTRDLLRRLRVRTSAELDEAYVRRLYYAAEGVLAIEGGVVAAGDKAAVGVALAEILEGHPDFLGRHRVAEIAAFARPVDPSVLVTAFAAPPASRPDNRLVVLPAAVSELRKHVQFDPDSGRRPPLVWDGIVVRRGFFDPQGVFVLDVIFGHASQRAALVELIDKVRDDAPFARPFGRHYRLTPTVRPLEPLLSRLRQVAGAYPELDRVSLDGAFHDVNNRLTLRYVYVGPDPVRVPKEAKATLLALIDEDARYKFRVDAKYLRMSEPGPLQLYEVESLTADPALARRRLLEAIGVLRLGVGDLSVACCARMTPGEVAAHRLAHAGEALKALDVALKHDPDDPIIRYVRAVALLALGDEVLARRDLRRMVEREKSILDGNSVRVERLQMLEHLQGDFRRRLEAMRKEAERDVDSKRPALRLTDLP